MKSDLTSKGRRIQNLTLALRDLGVKRTKVEDNSASQAAAIQQLKADFTEVETKKKNAEDTSKLLDCKMATAKMTALKAKYDGTTEETEARVKALEEENSRLGDETDAQIAALNTEHGDIFQRVTTTFAGEVAAVEDKNRHLRKEMEAVAKALANAAKNPDNEKAANKAKTTRGRQEDVDNHRRSTSLARHCRKRSPRMAHGSLHCHSPEDAAIATGVIAL